MSFPSLQYKGRHFRVSAKDEKCNSMDSVLIGKFKTFFVTGREDDNPEEAEVDYPGNLELNLFLFLSTTLIFIIQE